MHQEGVWMLGHGKHDEDALVVMQQSSTRRSAGALAG